MRWRIFWIFIFVIFAHFVYLLQFMRRRWMILTCVVPMKVFKHNRLAWNGRNTTNIIRISSGILAGDSLSWVQTQLSVNFYTWLSISDSNIITNLFLRRVFLWPPWPIIVIYRAPKILGLRDWKTPDHFWGGNGPYGRGAVSFVFSCSESFFHSEEILWARKSFMENCHEWVEHLRWYSLINVFELLVIHVFAVASSMLGYKNVIQKLLNFLLIV